jgi:hypothetical protein
MKSSHVTESEFALLKLHRFQCQSHSRHTFTGLAEAQVVECLPRKDEALSSNPNTTKKQKTKQQKSTFTEISRIRFDQIFGHCGPVNMSHKTNHHHLSKGITQSQQ